MPLDAAPPIVLEAGIGVGRYEEVAPGVVFEANIEPQVQVHAGTAWQVGDGQIIVEAAASFGTRVAMAATANGQVVQNNDFRMELYEASPRLRWPVTPHVAVEVGYRLTYQRLFFLDVPLNGQTLTAQEDVTVHAGEAGALWHRDGVAIGLGLGFDQGRATNDQIEGGNFSAGGTNFWIRGGKRWPSGFTLGAAWTSRTQNGSGAQTVTVQGMMTQATWPENTTWSLFVLAGYMLY